MSAVMHGSMQGQFIAQASARPNAQEETGARTPKGWLRPGCTSVCVGRGEAKADRYSETPADSVSNHQNP